MIIEYHRPQTLEDALALLARTELITLPMAGGSALNRPSAEAMAAVDLQSLGLDTISKRANNIDLGAMLTLQALLDFFLCAAVSRWSSGRTRVALGGFGSQPVLAFDGPESGGVEAAAISAYNQAEDEWASANYRKETAGILALRCLEQ